MIRHSALAFAALALLAGGCASTNTGDPNASDRNAGLAGAPPAESGQRFEDGELVQAISSHLGVTSESAASAIERLFAERGRPTAYITGEEGGGAVVFGARYGEGTLWMKDGRRERVYWQGPSVGFDVGAEASKVFTLVYGLDDPDEIFRRYPGVDGSAFLVAGMAVNYQRANGITLAPVRSGVGVRLGANVGYSSYTRKRGYIPL